MQHLFPLHPAYICSFLLEPFLYLLAEPLCGVSIFVTQPVFMGLVDPLEFWVFKTTQSNNFMLKYSTDAYFIPVTSHMNSKHGQYCICPFTLLDHIYELMCESFF